MMYVMQRQEDERRKKEKESFLKKFFLEVHNSPREHYT
jgi:hypothetical protein